MADDLLDELVRVWVRNGARSERSARKIAQQIGATFRMQRVSADEYRHLVDQMPGKDLDDHIHSAAAVAKAPSTLLTANTKDFPVQPLRRKGVAVCHPDDYFVDLLEQEPAAVMEVLTAMFAARSRPPMSLPNVLGTLERSGLTKFVAAASRHINEDAL